jgi:hypothetical protein
VSVDVSAAVIGLSQDVVDVVRRNGAGSYVAGDWVPSSNVSTTTYAANVQQASGRDIQKLPEGERTREAIVVYLPRDAGPFQVSERTAGLDRDRLVWRGVTFELARVEDWSSYGYWRALAVRVEG